ncbi:hypothetical protein AB0L06_25445 [Spirillospora sp. NPDC052269]
MTRGGEFQEPAGRFLDAFREGDVDALAELLAADVQMVSDSGGEAPQWGKGIAGAANVIRLLAAMSGPLASVGIAVEPRPVNGEPGAIFRDPGGRILNTWSIDILDGRIQAIRTVINPRVRDPQGAPALSA